mmetsp:Transcript_20853/g.53828  ORF Transcript_20853/g.53828 Transcript_20853/m.53828 type:complete len:244 (-) Transcript_20853:303-1034(-)
MQQLTHDRARAYVRKFVSFEAGKGQLDSVELRLQSMRLQAEKKQVEEKMTMLAQNPIFLPMLKRMFSKGRPPSVGEERFVLAIQSLLEQGVDLNKEEFFAICSNLDYQDFDNEGVFELMLSVLEGLDIPAEEFRSWLSDHTLPIPQGLKARIEVERTAKLTSTTGGGNTGPRPMPKSRFGEIGSRPGSFRNLSVSVSMSGVAAALNKAHLRNMSVFSPTASTVGSAGGGGSFASLKDTVVEEE